VPGSGAGGAADGALAKLKDLSDDEFEAALGDIRLDQIDPRKLLGRDLIDEGT
jgi:hypothetical protein